VEEGLEEEEHEEEEEVVAAEGVARECWVRGGQGAGVAAREGLQAPVLLVPRVEAGLAAVVCRGHDRVGQAVLGQAAEEEAE
jgi:hypothetical protein